MARHNALKMISDIQEGKVNSENLSLDTVQEADVVMVIGDYGNLYQRLPRRFKTLRVRQAVVIGKADGIKMIGHENVTDELACDAIDLWGKSAFMVMNDLNKTPAVALHAIRNNVMAYRDIKKDVRTQEMSDLAFELNFGLIYDIPEGHLTGRMLKHCIEKMPYSPRIRWPSEIVTPEIVELIAATEPTYSSLIPDRLLTPTVLALCSRKEPERIGKTCNALVAIEAISYSLDELRGQTNVTAELLENAIEKIDVEAELLSFVAGPQPVSKKKEVKLPPQLQALKALANLIEQETEKAPAAQVTRIGLYAWLHKINAGNPALLAAHNEYQNLLPDLMARLHGPRVAVKFFPKAPNRGHWLEQELGL